MHPAAQALLDAAVALLREGRSPDDLTARAITERAGCALGLLNYHFGDRDSLLRQAVGSLVAEAAGGYFEGPGVMAATADPEAFVASMVKVSGVMVRLGPAGEFLARQALLRGGFDLSAAMLPSMGVGPGTPPAQARAARLRAIHFLLGLQAMLTRRGELEVQTGAELASEDFTENFIRDLARRLLSADWEDKPPL